VLHPLCIEDLYVRLAKDQEITFLQRTMQAKCASFGSKILFRDGVGIIELSYPALFMSASAATSDFYAR
jgi:hypothetical protein